MESWSWELNGYMEAVQAIPSSTMHPQSNKNLISNIKFNNQFTALDKNMQILEIKTKKIKFFQNFGRKLLGSKVKRVGDDQEDDYPTGYFYTSQDSLELEQFGYILQDTQNEKLG